MTQFDLLNKTELKIDHIALKNANLTQIASTVASTLGLASHEVLVVDVRDRAIVLDILRTCVNAFNIVGKKERLLGDLGILPGVTVSERTSIRSDGMLGWIAMDEDIGRKALEESESLASSILEHISKRVMVFPTGREVANRDIEDTNTPAIMDRLVPEGYKVCRGDVLKDDRQFIAAKLREAVDTGGYGIIVTTGGVGAEDKDQTVEAIKMLDPEAATPYICHFVVGTGRHVKDGVKIAVGEYGGARLIALPGPNDEVRASLDPIVSGLKTGSGKKVLAEMIAGGLRQILRQKMNDGQHDGHGQRGQGDFR